MKIAFQLFLVILALSSCSNKSGDRSGTIVSDTLNDRTEKALIQINRNFPFGCENLTTKYWPADPKRYGRLKQPDEKEFEKLSECYAQINKTPTLPLKPEITESQHIKIGKDFQNTAYFDTIAQQSCDSLKYRLPDVGIYQCYYFFEQSKIQFGDYGTLLLFEPNIKTGKTLTIYYEVGGDQHVNYRYFFIAENAIKIFEGACYDDGCSLTEKFTVNIEADGKITVNELK